MRLRDYQKILADNIPQLKFQCEQVAYNGGLKQLSNYVGAMKAMHVFEENQLFLDLISSVKQHNDIYNNNNEPYIVSSTVADELNRTINNLCKSASNLKNTIDNILEKEDESCVYFKLPEYKNIEELTDFFNTLKMILNVFKHIGQDPEFKGFDTGSEYLLFCFSAVPYLVLLYQIIDKSIILRNKKLEGDKTVAQIEKLKSEKKNNDINSIKSVIDILNETNKAEYDKLKESLIEEIIKISEIKIKEKNEFKNLLGVALEKAGILIDKGMKLIPSYKSSSDILQISADLDKHIQTYQNAYIGIKEMRLLEEKKEEESTTEENDNKKE